MTREFLFDSGLGHKSVTLSHISVTFYCIHCEVYLVAPDNNLVVSKLAQVSILDERISPA